MNKPIFVNLKTESIKNVFNNSINYDVFDEAVNEKYIYLQKLFCKNQNENLDQLIENNTVVLDIIKIH